MKNTRNMPKLRFPEFRDALDNPLPASPLSGGGASPTGNSSNIGAAQFPPLARGGLGWGCLKALAYALSRNLSPTLIDERAHEKGLGADVALS